MKKMITILGIFTITLISLGTVANDYSADRVKVDMTRTPSVNTAGQRAETKATNNTTMLNNQNTRINNNSNLIIDVDKKIICLYPSSASSDCKKKNISHKYQTKSWKKPGTYHWKVPKGITEVYVLMKGGDGGTGGQGSTYLYTGCDARMGFIGPTGSNGGAGRDSFFGNVFAKGAVGGAGSAGGRLNISCFPNLTRIAPLGQPGTLSISVSYRVNVIPGTKIKIRVGAGGVGGWGGHDRYHSLKGVSRDGIHGADGADGFVSIQY